MKSALKKVNTDTLKKYEKLIAKIQSITAIALLVSCIIALALRGNIIGTIGLILLIVELGIIVISEGFGTAISKEIVHRKNEQIIMKLSGKQGYKININLNKHHEEKIEGIILEEVLKKCEIQGKYNDQDNTISFIFIFNDDTCEVKLNKEMAISHIQNL